MTPEPLEGAGDAIRCAHCERVFSINDTAHPVIISGGQSYAGHLIPRRPGARHGLLCTACYVNLQNADIDGFSVVDDEGAVDGH